jgi:hypothetical protein
MGGVSHAADLLGEAVRREVGGSERGCGEAVRDFVRLDAGEDAKPSTRMMVERMRVGAGEGLYDRTVLERLRVAVG